MNPVAGFSIGKVLLHSTPDVLQSYLRGRGLCKEKDLPALQEELGKREYAKQLDGEYWTAEGNLEPSLLTPAMEIIFCLDRNRRSLNIHGDSPVTINEMHKILALEVFAKEIPEEPEGKPHYDMEKVLDEIIRLKRLAPQVRGTTPITDIWLNAIRLRLRTGGEITLNGQQKKRSVEGEIPDKIYYLLRKIVQLEEGSKRSIKREDVTPVWMEFIVAYRDELTGKAATTRFTFTSKTGSNLGHSDLEEAIRTCLIDSGYINGHADTPPIIEKHEAADESARIPA